MYQHFKQWNPFKNLHQAKPNSTFTTPIRANCNQQPTNKTKNKQYASTPSEQLKERNEMFRKTKPDNEIPNRRFNEINEARNIQKKKIFENNRYSNLIDEGQEDLVNLVSEDTGRQDNQEFTVVKATKRANQESNIHKSSYQTKAIFYSAYTGDSLHKYKDYKLIYKQLKQFKPNIHVKSAFLNKNNE